MAWYDNAVFYHIYPLGLCGCAHENDGQPVPGAFKKLDAWAEHAAKLGCTAIYIGPLFESGSHGYDTIDYRLVNGMIATAEYTKISPNGRWIAGAYRTEKLAGNDIARTQYPAFFNTETGKTTIVTDFGEGYASHATDDGLGIILLGTFLPSSGIVYDIEHQVSLGSVEEWVSDNYGIVIPTGYITYITPDRSRLMGNVLESTAVGTRVVSWYVAPPLEK